MPIHLNQRFEDLRNRGEKALILFLTAGDQPLDQLPAIVEALREGGADIVEIGLPFSDPFGEGPTIQASSQRSLANGTTPQAILEAVGNIYADVALVTMGYYNPVLRYGLEEFAQTSAKVGATGTIISDLVPDESDAWCSASDKAGIGTIFLIAPTSTEQRIQEVAERTTGFVYVVSRTGVTGAENQVPTDVTGLVQRVKALTDRPVAVGFGISKPEHVKMVCQVADGAVVGSFLVDLLHREWDNGAGRNKIIDAVRRLKEATKA